MHDLCGHVSAPLFFLKDRLLNTQYAKYSMNYSSERLHVAQYT